MSIERSPSKSPKPHRDDRDWPYAEYPASLPRRGLSVDGPYPVPAAALSPHGGEQVISVQDLPEDAHQFLIVIVPACESVLGVSLLGPDAEHEATQIVFIVSPENGAVWTYNQCG